MPAGYQIGAVDDLADEEHQMLVGKDNESLSVADHVLRELGGDTANEVTLRTGAHECLCERARVVGVCRENEVNALVLAQGRSELLDSLVDIMAVMLENGTEAVGDAGYFFVEKDQLLFRQARDGLVTTFGIVEEMRDDNDMGIGRMFSLNERAKMRGAIMVNVKIDPGFLPDPLGQCIVDGLAVLIELIKQHQYFQFRCRVEAVDIVALAVLRRENTHVTKVVVALFDGTPGYCIKAAEFVDRRQTVAAVDEAGFGCMQYCFHELLVNGFGRVAVDGEVVFEVDLSHEYRVGGQCVSARLI